MKKRTTKSPRMVGFIVITLAVIIWLVIWGNSPQQGTVSRTPQFKPQTSHGSQKLDGTYFSLTHSDIYNVKKESPKDADKERYTLTADTTYEKRALISVTELTDGKLESNGAYLFRQKNPAVYTSRKVQASVGVITIWVKNDGTEQTAMLPHTDKLAIISLTTTNTQEDLTSEMDAILQTFRWK